MRHNAELVHEETHDGYGIKLYFGPEDYAPDWDMTDEERADLDRKIERGHLLWFYAHVVAERDGFTGEDYLGGCCYESVADFIGPNGDYYRDMVNEAIAKCRKAEQKYAMRRCFT